MRRIFFLDYEFFISILFYNFSLLILDWSKCLGFRYRYCHKTLKGWGKCLTNLLIDSLTLQNINTTYNLSFLESSKKISSFCILFYFCVYNVLFLFIYLLTLILFMQTRDSNRNSHQGSRCSLYDFISQ